MFSGSECAKGTFAQSATNVFCYHHCAWRPVAHYSPKVLKTLKRMFITMLWECAVLLSAIHSNLSLATSLYCCLSNLTMLAVMLSYPPLKLALATSHVCIQSSS
jgi:hypothetical protein